jgi:hypothetical protein
VDKPFIGVARWTEYYPGEKMGFIWDKMPHGQLAKCAEALALRKAFPKKLKGLYVPEEMEQTERKESAVVVKQQERASTVKPKETIIEAQEEPVDNETGETPMTVADEITAHLADLCDGDYPTMNKMLAEVSKFPGKNGDVWIKSIDDLAGVSEGWQKKTLAKLKAKMNIKEG